MVGSVFLMAAILLQRRYAIANPNPISTSPGLSHPVQLRFSYRDATRSHSQTPSVLSSR
ncbi:MAG: hypothetical protein F6K50_04115 [Moorea sp. SIO3I7]|uniref:hypothetical protein n=2 Tax=unclassified Moorena TaxID=2683338 RepID=UPI0013CBDEA7|nr:hypothetical protein [Moorena sp. SIO3I8]NEN94737.1 hypothetical protein [Moorena sp. SIO3I7]